MTDAIAEAELTAFAATPIIDLGTRKTALTRNLRFQRGDRLGTAVFEGYRSTHSTDWHEQRATGYGGSDVAAICGCSKWQTPYSLWAERTGLVPREDDGKNVAAKEWGSRLEPVILDYFEELHPGLILVRAPRGEDMSWRHESRAYQLASPDALAFNPADGSWSIVECKTGRFDDDWKDEDGDRMVPAYYETQDQWYLDVFGFELSVFCVLFSGSEYREYPLEADEVEQRVNRKQVEAFIAAVANKVAPPYSGTPEEVYTVRRQHPEIIKTEEAEVGPVGQRWLDAKVACDAAEKELSVSAAELLERMGSAGKGTINGQHKINRQARNGGVPYLIKRRGA